MRFDLRNFALTGLLAIAALNVSGQAALNMNLLGHLPYTEQLSNLKGAYYNGREYALVGVYDGFSIVDITDPANPDEVFFEPGPETIWREPFYYNGHAYCVTEAGGGLLIVDMSPLPSVTNLPTNYYTGSTIPWSSAHTMFIDSVSARAYIYGSDHDEGGAIILDLTDPMNPTELGQWNDHYIHDGYVRGDTLWAACLENGVHMVDVSNPANPVNMTSWFTPSVFAHNVWPSDDNAFCYTTDEVNSAFITGYDMADLQNVVETDRVRHPLSEGVIPHNTHFLNDYIITSHYRDGVTIHDVSDPSNIILTGYYDTSPLSGSSFNGAWGAWPYLPSGNIIVSDMEEGLFIIGPDYVQAARIQGTVTEFGTGDPLNDVQIEVMSTPLAETTDIFGDYATGIPNAGTFSVQFQKGGFLPQTITGVVLQNGQTVTLDVELVPDVAFTVGGTVTDAGTGTPIEGATVQMVSEFFDLAYTTDSQGQYTESNFFSGSYDVTVGAWGYQEQCLTVDLNMATNQNFELEPGYSDEFVLDLGWTVGGNATTGVWVRDYPVGTDFNGMQANPDADVADDCGGQAYVTGNSVGAVNIDDVDDGATVLTSPSMDLTGYLNPVVSFYYWFFNDGGSSTPNDELIVRIDNGSSNPVTVSSLPTTQGQWVIYEFPVADFVSVTNDMQLVFNVQDAAPGHLVEAGLDRFKVYDAIGIDDISGGLQVSVYPNPADGDLVNVLLGSMVGQGSVTILDAAGKLVSIHSDLIQGVNKIQLPTASGFYLLETRIDGKRDVQRLLVQ